MPAPGNLWDMRNAPQTPILLFFTNSRSGPARRMESLLAHLARKERSRLRVALMDADQQPDWIERQLAHVEINKIRRAYNAAQYLEHRTRMMLWWSDYLDRAKAKTD